jgi:hypothetical protein
MNANASGLGSDLIQWGGSMIRRITRIAPWQAGKFFATLYFILGLVFAVPFALIALLSPPAEGQAPFGVGFAIALPFIYALGGLIFVPIACWIFNFVARMVGGLEVEVLHTEG